jgi:hypothetical protein
MYVDLQQSKISARVGNTLRQAGNNNGAPHTSKISDSLGPSSFQISAGYIISGTCRIWLSQITARSNDDRVECSERGSTRAHSIRWRASYLDVALKG